MRVVGGGLVAACLGAMSWLLARVTTHNLPASLAVVTPYVLLAAGLALGYLAGAAIFRRAERDREGLGLFAVLAGGVAGGLTGLLQAVIVTAGYLATYSTWPDDRLDQVFVLLAYPIFAIAGFSLGAAIGLILGLLLGGVLRLAVR